MFHPKLFLTIFCFATLLPAALLGQVGPSVEERAAITAAIDERVAGIVPGPMLQTAKSTYLEGYGLVVTIEVALALPRNPFTGLRSPEEIRRTSNERRLALKEATVDLLGAYVPEINSIRLDDRVAIVIYMLNTNPADLPDLPTQIVVSVTKRDAADLRSTAISKTAFADRVVMREY